MRVGYQKQKASNSATIVSRLATCRSIGCTTWSRPCVASDTSPCPSGMRGWVIGSRIPCHHAAGDQITKGRFIATKGAATRAA